TATFFNCINGRSLSQAALRNTIHAISTSLSGYCKLLPMMMDLEKAYKGNPTVDNDCSRVQTPDVSDI
ncbi:MAG: hypothetical protein VXZ27_12725, partial [SAR324 cluster bacterium]|nr:hypothetical protein [SAR324 cluster bacterium]